MGLNQVSWNLARSARVILFTLARCPVPMKVVVGMSFAVEQRRHDAQAHGDGRDFFALDGGEAFFLQALEFLLGEGRMENEVGVNVEGFIEIELERVEADEGIIEIGAGIEVGAERFEIFADFQRIARRSALFQHALSEAAGAESASGVGGVAAFDQQREIDDGRGVALRENDFQAVGERGFLHGRKIERLGGAFRGRLGTIEVGPVLNRWDRACTSKT